MFEVATSSLWVQFFLELGHFAVTLGMGLAMFAVGWLYFDAWQTGRKTKLLLRAGGFGLLWLSFLVHGAGLEGQLLVSEFRSSGIGIFLEWILRVGGYGLVIWSLILDPLQEHPDTGGSHEESLGSGQSSGAAGVVPIFANLKGIFPVLSAMVAWQYWKRATRGLEQHLKPVAIAFLALTVMEILSLASLMRETTNIFVYRLVAAFGWMWMLEHLLLLVAMILLLRWVMAYLLKRFATQIFMVFVSGVMLIYLITTATFTSLLVGSVQREVLGQLETDVKVMGFAVESLQSVTLADAEVLSVNVELVEAVIGDRRRQLAELVEQYLLVKKQSTLTVIDADGKVLARGDDRERFGSSVSEDPLVARALAGEGASSVVVRDGVVAPEVLVRSVTPIKKDDRVVGVVMAGAAIDNAFVDGVKTVTGLDSLVYGGNKLSATTAVGPGGDDRPVGISVEKSEIIDAVLDKGESYSGSVQILNVPYFGAYLPLKDVDSIPVGMLFVGKPQIGVLQTAGKSVELTFVVAGILILASIFPAYLVSRNIARQIK